MKFPFRSVLRWWFLGQPPPPSEKNNQTRNCSARKCLLCLLALHCMPPLLRPTHDFSVSGENGFRFVREPWWLMLSSGYKKYQGTSQGFAALCECLPRLPSSPSMLALFLHNKNKYIHSSFRYWSDWFAVKSKGQSLFPSGAKQGLYYFRLIFNTLLSFWYT